MDEMREMSQPVEAKTVDAPSGGPDTVEGRTAMAGASTDAPVKSAEQVAGAGQPHDAPYEWVDRGIRDVPVDALPWPEGVTAENFDHHITHEDALRVTHEIEAMKPQIESGFKSEDFAAEDRQRGLDWAHGRQRIYDLYYGNDPVRVYKDGDNYTVDKGKHRVFAAKEAGSQTIPANVREKVMKDGI